MTPDQQKQIALVRIAIKRMDGRSKEWIIAELRKEGWPEAAIQANMEEMK